MVDLEAYIDIVTLPRVLTWQRFDRLEWELINVNPHYGDTKTHL
jgi:hypothetical protein